MTGGVARYGSRFATSVARIHAGTRCGANSGADGWLLRGPYVATAAIQPRRLSLLQLVT